jgi:hypothetical protein
MKGLLAVVAVVLLAGCESDTQVAAMADAQDDARCRSWGAQSGDAAYTQCRSQLFQVRAAERAQSEAQVRRFQTCYSVGNFLHCN